MAFERRWNVVPMVFLFLCAKHPVDLKSLAGEEVSRARSIELKRQAVFPATLRRGHRTLLVIRDLLPYLQKLLKRNSSYLNGFQAPTLRA